LSALFADNCPRNLRATGLVHPCPSVIRTKRSSKPARRAGAGER
jgi:hypothetical protein